MNTLPPVDVPGYVNEAFQESLELSCPQSHMYLIDVVSSNKTYVYFGIQGPGCQWDGFSQRVFSKGLIPNGWTNFQLIQVTGGDSHVTQPITQEMNDVLEQAFPNHAILLTKTETNRSKKEITFYFEYEGNLDLKLVNKLLTNALHVHVVLVGVPRDL